MVLLFAGATSVAADNATALSYAIEKAAKTHSTLDAEQVVVEYLPTRAPKAPYDLILFPDHQVTQSDLVAAGLSEAAAAQVFSKLDYIDVGSRPLIVVLQEGRRLNFTGHWRRFARVDALTVIHGQGPTHLVFAPSDQGLVLVGTE